MRSTVSTMLGEDQVEVLVPYGQTTKTEDRQILLGMAFACVGREPEPRRDHAHKLGSVSALS